MDTMQIIVDNIYSIVGIILTAFFGLVSMYYYIKSKAEKSLIVLYNDIELQTKTHPDITITYKSRKIDSLNKMLILFLNNGQKEIRKADIPSKSAPSLNFENVNILSTTIKEVTESSNNLELKNISDNQYAITFDYLNPKDGGLFEFLYDIKDDNGDSDETIVLSVIGALIGVKTIDVKLFSKYTSDLQTISEYVSFIIIAIILYVSMYFLFKTGHNYWGAFFVYLSGGMTFKIIREMFLYFNNTVPEFAHEYFE
mgnify:FL=1|jgi:hypothetical protein